MTVFRVILSIDKITVKLKITLYKDGKTSEIIINHKGARMVNVPINGLPQDGGGGGGGGFGQPRGNLTFSGFQVSISLPLGLHYKSTSHCLYAFRSRISSHAK